MVIAYVLMNVAPEGEKQVYDALCKYEQVKYAHLLLEEYNLIAKIECKDMQKISKFILKEIHSIEQVIGTKTLIADTFSEEKTRS